MPIYEYRCEACRHRFEVLQRLGAGEEEVACPMCGSPKVKKLLSTFASSVGGGEGTRGASPSACAPSFG